MSPNIYGRNPYPSDPYQAMSTASGAMVRQQGCGPDFIPPVCETTWKTSPMSSPSDDASAAYCPEVETSDFVRRGNRRMRSVYVEGPDFSIITPDVIGDNLGTFGNFRRCVSFAKGFGPGNNNVYNLANDPNMLFVNDSPNTTCSLGVLIRVTFTVSLAAIPVLTLTTGFTTSPLGRTLGTTGSVDRVGLQLQCNNFAPAITIFLPWRSLQVGAVNSVNNVYGPCVGVWNGLAVPAPGISGKRITVTGIPAGSGTTYVQWVGPYSQELPKVVAAMMNAAPSD